MRLCTHPALARLLLMLLRRQVGDLYTHALKEAGRRSLDISTQTQNFFLKEILITYNLVDHIKLFCCT